MREPDKTPEPIEEYLAEVEKLLKRRLPADIAEQRLAEAREHLAERSEELIAGGLTYEQAQSSAVKSFGPAREWARSIAQAAYAGTGAVTARRIGTAFGVLAALCAFGVPVTASLNRYMTAYAAMGCVAVYLLALAALAVLAFRSRRPATLFLASIGAIAILGGAVYTGAMFVGGAEGVWPRAQIAPSLGNLPVELAYYQAESGLLDEGISAYASDAIAGPLRTASGAYIVPKPLPRPFMLPEPGTDWDAPSHLVMQGYHYFITPDGPAISAFKEFTPAQRQEFSHDNYYATFAARLQIMDEAPYRTAATPAAAAVEWKKWGPRWLEMIRCGSQQDQAEMASFGIDSQGNVGFSWLLARLCGYFMLIATAPIVLLDLLAAHSGRWAFSRRRVAPGPTSA